MLTARKNKPRATIAVDKIKGDAGGIPFVSLTVEDAEFRQAIELSLELVGLSRPDAQPRYSLRAVIVGSDVPFFQLGDTTRATYAVQYDLYESATGKNVYSRRIETIYKQDKASNRLNVNRGYQLVGGAIRENLKLLALDLLKLKL